jgi:Fe2+ transport system protein FeoA
VDGGDEVSLRLMEMGLTPGVELSIVGVAPLGDPLELDVRGYRLSLRRAEADRVEVESL